MPEKQAWNDFIAEKEMSPEVRRFAGKTFDLVDAETCSKLSHESRIEIRRALPSIVSKSITNRNVVWDIGRVLTSAEGLLEARDIVYDLISNAGWSFSNVVSLSLPATPLAVLLATDERISRRSPSPIRLRHFDNATLNIYPDDFSKDEPVVLIDTLVRSGWHMSTACEYIKSKGANVVGVAALCLGVSDVEDLEGALPTIHEMLRGRTLIYAYSWSQLSKLAEKGGIEVRK